MKDKMEDIWRKMRETEREFGSIKDAVLITSYDDIGEQTGGLRHVHSPTNIEPTLGNVPWEVARFFEDI